MNGGVFHKGIDAGFVGGKPLDPKHEVLAKLLKGELVLNPPQMDNILNNVIPNFVRQFKVPELSDVGRNISYDINLNMGSVTVTNEMDAKKLANIMIDTIDERLNFHARKARSSLTVIPGRW